VPIRVWSRILKGRGNLKERNTDKRILSKRLLDKASVENMDWIDLDHDEVRRSTFVSTVIILRLP
jgi:hypothetical protein